MDIYCIKEDTSLWLYLHMKAGFLFINQWGRRNEGFPSATHEILPGMILAACHVHLSNEWIDHVGLVWTLASICAVCKVVKSFMRLPPAAGSLSVLHRERKDRPSHKQTFPRPHFLWASSTEGSQLPGWWLPPRNVKQRCGQKWFVIYQRTSGGIDTKLEEVCRECLQKDKIQAL